MARLTVITRAHVGYEMTDSQRGGLSAELAIIGCKREGNNCFIKNNQEILLDLADFALQEHTRRRFNGRYFSGIV